MRREETRLGNRGRPGGCTTTQAGAPTCGSRRWGALCPRGRVASPASCRHALPPSRPLARGPGPQGETGTSWASEDVSRDMGPGLPAVAPAPASLGAGAGRVWMCAGEHLCVSARLCPRVHTQTRMRTGACVRMCVDVRVCVCEREPECVCGRVSSLPSPGLPRGRGDSWESSAHILTRKPRPERPSSGSPCTHTGRGRCGPAGVALGVSWQEGVPRAWGLGRCQMLGGAFTPGGRQTQILEAHLYSALK